MDTFLIYVLMRFTGELSSNHLPWREVLLNTIVTMVIRVT